MRNLSFFLRFDDENGRSEPILLSVAALFVFSNAVALGLARDGRIDGSTLLGPLFWLIAQITAVFLLQKYAPNHDPYLLPIIGLLTGWGIVLQDRLAPDFLLRQVVWVVLGTAVIVAITLLPRSLRWLRHYRYTLLLLGIFLLAATLLFGTNPSGASAARYWLRLPIPFFTPVYFQPSELLKLLLVIFLASYFDERETSLRLARNRLQEKNGRLQFISYLAPLLLMWGFCMILLVWQRDLGAATLFFILFLSLLYLATGDWRIMAGGVLLLLLAGIFAYYAFSLVTLRIDAWWNPWPDADNRAFQIVQSLYAVAAGGIWGQGVGQGFPQYIPVVHSDFAFAAIAEEWGLIGSLSVVGCFALLAHRGLRVALLAERPFHRYLSAGIIVLFSAQAFLIMGGVTKLLPLTGVTLPFVSYGGSSMLISHVMAGLLLYLSTKSRQIHL
ncbi:FtsW-like cell division membrane protein CA_C0505 [hydrothermal vent metagenome]|uniref:FtsW-like cell division membrane protein CA_C0505 n=1 Tax=hydrothermal vent metagenome TaxID=652676 RepID=A0A3B0UV67_9ZZZZ